MKIGRLHIILEKENDLITKAGRKLSKVDLDRIKKYIDGGYHFVRRSKGRKPKVPLFIQPPPKEEDKCRPETCAGQCQGMNSRAECPNVLEEDDESHAVLPRHTPEELDRLIEVVREANSPESKAKEVEK